MLFTFVGCSGVGKNTIIGDLLKKHEDTYDLLPTVTTRDMRPGESQGNPYLFVKMDEFKKMIEDGEMYEYEWIHENLYGGSRKILNGKLSENKILLKDIDVLGSQSLKKAFKGEFPVISLFLYVNDVEIILDRLRKRGEPEEGIQKRRKRFDMEMSLSGTGDYLINNISREDTGSLIDKIIACETEKRVYALADSCALPNEDEVQALTEEARKGASLARVEMAFNGEEILILEGAERYAAAVRAGAFIQKHFVNAVSRDVKASCDRNEWNAFFKA